MSDELTPEEREALRNLPRERMPSAALEDRVVGAMRERGILSAKKPGRVVRLTTGRTAGLLAACIVLVIGAYSIGLQRGTTDEVISRVQPEPSTPARESFEMQSIPAEIPPAEPSAGAEMTQSDAATTPDAAATPEAPPTLSIQEETTELQARAEEHKELDWDLAKDAEKRDESAQVDDVADAVAQGLTARAKRSDQPQPPSSLKAMYGAKPAENSAGLAAPRQRSFTLGGTALVVEAPDSVRIVQGENGRTLLIYTSDGLIRIRLAD